MLKRKQRLDSLSEYCTIGSLCYKKGEKFDSFQIFHAAKVTSIGYDATAGQRREKSHKNEKGK